MEEIDTYLKESKFRLTEQDDGILLQLSKDVGDRHLEIFFEAR